MPTVKMAYAAFAGVGEGQAEKLKGKLRKLDFSDDCDIACTYCETQDGVLTLDLVSRRRQTVLALDSARRVSSEERYHYTQHRFMLDFAAGLVITPCSVTAIKLAGRREALLAKFAHLVPAPDEGKKWKATAGAASMGSYRHEPNRLPDLRVEGLREHAAELDALGLVKYQPELSITETRKYIAANGEAPPHIVLVPKSPVTYSPPKQAAGLAGGISEVEPAPAAETDQAVAA